MAEISANASAPADWYKPCSEEHLAEIAAVVTAWREISPFLGITEAEEHEILGSAPHSVRSQKIAMLRLWKKKKGRAATYDQLSRVFRKCECLDLEETLKQLLEDSEVVYGGPSSNPSPRSDPLIPYASYLKELYTYMSQSHTSQQWSHLPRCEFIQLAMIKDEEMRRGGPEEEMIRLAQQGEIETILCNKESIDLCSLFPQPPYPLVVLPPPPPPPGRVFLIEGAPGGGKSTLALYICHQWAQGASWIIARFDVVVLVYLRDEAVQNASSLADILPTHEIEKSRTIASQIQASYGRNVLFVFDGWDEFPPIKMDKSIVSTIVRQPQKLSLHQSTVLITSRPVSSGNLLHIADRRVEILGFTQHQIREYIEKALNGNSTQIQKLVHHLEEHPVVEGYCYIPLHSAILVHIFLTMKEALPTTLHELFCDLVLCRIVWEHKTHEPDTSLPELSVLDDLPDDLKSNLKTLSKLAYIGVIQDKIVFYLRDLQEFQFSTEEKLPSLGLLQAVEGLSKVSISVSYNFLHLSVQELLAAYHISLMDPRNQVKEFKKLFESPRFHAVILYFCGFTKLINPEIQKLIIDYQHKMGNFKELLPLLHCFFEAHEPSLCQLVFPKFAANMILDNISNPSDYLAIGYFIASLLSTSTADMPPMVLSSLRCELYCLKLLLNELSKYPPKKQPIATCSLPRKLTISLYGCPRGDNALYFSKQLILIADHLKVSSAINEFRSEASGFQNNDGDGLFHLVEALQTNTSLTKLSLVNVNLRYTEKNCPALISMLRVNKSLTHVDLSWNELFLEAHYIFEGLQYNTSLVNLNLSCTGITADPADTTTSFIKMIQVNKSLEYLNLSFNDFTDSLCHSMIESLQRNTSNLIFLNLSKSISPKMIQILKCSFYY